MRDRGLTIGSLILTILAVSAVIGVLSLSVSFFLDGRADLSRRRTALQLASSTMGEMISLEIPPDEGITLHSIYSGGDEYSIETSVILLPDNGREIHVGVTTLHGEMVRLDRRLYTGVEYEYRMDNKSV